MWQLANVSLRPEAESDSTFVEELVIAIREGEPGFRDLPAEERTSLLKEQVRLQSADYRRKFPQAHFLIIMASGHPVGRFYIDHTPDRLRIVDLSILPDYQGHGIGHQLMKSVLAEGTRTSLPVRLSVMIGNPALDFYLKLGFVTIDKLESHLRMEWVSKAPA
ncbi:GNAT family N-acetyltransferase [bacterium]|nr:GNAT family N-acetyltransferase [bacterium]